MYIVHNIVSYTWCHTVCSRSFLSTLLVLSLLSFLQKVLQGRDSRTKTGWSRTWSCKQYCKKKRKTLWDYWFWFLVVWSALVASGKKLQILWYRNQLNSHSISEVSLTSLMIKCVPDIHSGTISIHSTNHTILVSKRQNYHRSQILRSWNEQSWFMIHGFKDRGLKYQRS